MKDNKCTILVNSCDSYEDLWNPFFKCLTENWKNIPYEIVLNTETKAYKCEYCPVTTFQLYKNNKVAWGKRLIDTLKKIKSKYVIMLLDDFFLQSPVDTKTLNQCIKWMDKDENIAVFSFWRTRGKNIKSEKYANFEKRPVDGEYRFNCQAAIWRRDRLIKFIRKHESPWDWELLGSIRSRRYKDEFYSSIEGTPHVFDYYTGGVIHRGKWIIGAITPIIERYNLKIDLNQRGYQEEDYVYNEQKLTFFQKVKHVLRYKITKLKSII